MTPFRFVLDDISAQIEAAFVPKGAATPSMFDVIAKASTDTIHQAGDELKTKGRGNIAAAGFSTKWQNAYRIQFFPARGISIDAAVWAFHKIPYASIFEFGGTITGKQGMLWLPFSSVPKLGRGRATPRRLAQSGVKLFSMKSAKGGLPLLATEVRVSKGQAANAGSLKLSLSKLRSGVKGKRGVVRAIPLFFGLDSVTIRKRFDLEGVAMTIKGHLGEMYVANVSAAGN